MTQEAVMLNKDMEESTSLLYSAAQLGESKNQINKTKNNLEGDLVNIF